MTRKEPLLAVCGCDETSEVYQRRPFAPFGTRGWWYDAWRSPEVWERYLVPAAQCPRISAEFLDEERRTMGQWWFAQEYDCEFLDAETQPFSREDIERAFEEEVEAWDL